MTQIFASLLISLGLTALAAVPFINLLYRLKFQRQKEVHVLSPIFTKLHAWKVGTPNSGGVLVILVTVILGYLLTRPGLNPNHSSVAAIFFALLTFGALGLYDDIKKYFGYQKEKFWGMRLRYKLIIQVLLSLALGFFLFNLLQVNGAVSLVIPLVGSFDLGQVPYIIFAGVVIVATANAFNITDGVDGLSSGLLLLTLFSLLAISLGGGGLNPINTFSQLPLQMIIATWVGSMIAFLYFNIHPARVWMGDSGALAFGAALAVVSLLLGAGILLVILGGVYVVETLSSLLQWYSWKVRGKRMFLIAPLHHHFEALGWPETKVTMRFWIAGAIFSLLALYIYYLTVGL